MGEGDIVTKVAFEDLVEILLNGAVYDESNDSEYIAALKLQPDKTLRTYSLEIGNANGQETLVELEDDGTPKVVLYGKDSGANQDPLRTDDAQKLRTREFEPYRYVVPDDIPLANTDLYTVPASTLAVVEIEAVCSGVAGTITIHVRPSGVAAAASNLIVNGLLLPINTVGVRLGPYVMQAGGIVTAIANPANSITVHTYVREYGTGDPVAY
jgi:hypothetical protein